MLAFSQQPSVISAMDHKISSLEDKFSTSIYFSIIYSQIKNLDFTSLSQESLPPKSWRGVAHIFRSQRYHWKVHE